MPFFPSSNRLVASLYAAADTAERNWARDRTAAVKIQSRVRAHQQRRRFLHLRRCAVTVQRQYRGYCGRLRVLALRIVNANERQLKIFSCHARNIQRVFRGFLCRKYTNDFCAQKAYIARIAQTSESVRQAAIRAREDQEAFLEKEQAGELRKDFELAVRDKHHLLSTAVSAGVLRAPLAPEGTQTVFGTDIEEEIRSIPIERPKRSKFLRDVIPPTNDDGSNNTSNNNNSASARTSKRRGNNADAKSSSCSATTRSSSKKSEKRTVQNMTVAKVPYLRTLQSEAEYESSDRDISRKVEEKVVAAVHGRNGAYFHVPKHQGGASSSSSSVPVVSGYLPQASQLSKK